MKQEVVKKVEEAVRREEEERGVVRIGGRKAEG